MGSHQTTFASVEWQPDLRRGIAMIPLMPRKVCEVISDLLAAGFSNRGGKGSHRNFVDPKGPRVTISGRSGDGAHHYQERQARQRIKESKQ